THFWGYFMGPSGRILGIASPDPIASYQLEYNQSGHRIFTADLDLLHGLPLPARHPQNLTQLKPGERRSWTIFLEAIDSLEDVKPRLAALTRAPMIEAERYTLAEGEKARVTVWSSGPVQLQVYSPSRSNNPVAYMKMLDVQPAGSGVWRAEFTPKDGRGA